MNGMLREPSIEKKVYTLHAKFCKTLAHPKRLEILNLLRNNEKSVTELVQLSRIPQTSMSQHLALLRENGVVIARREGKNIYYKVADPKITQACEMIREALFGHLAREEKMAKTILQRR